MELAVVVGNCQAAALEMLLNTNDEFSRRFEFSSFPPVHEIPAEMVAGLHEALAVAKIVVLQRIDEGYRDGLGLGTETLAKVAGAATVVRWPSVYWAGYFPDLFYLRNENGDPVVDGPFDYHDRVILEGYVAGLGVAETIQRLKDPGLPSNAQSWAESSTAELEVRGKGCDVEITSFIASKFREELLFFTMNHPANVLLGHIATQVMDLTGIPGSIDHRKLPDQVLGSTFYPLHSNHARALDLAFGSQAEDPRFRIRGVSYQAVDVVEMFFDYYAEHPDLVALNRDAAVL